MKSRSGRAGATAGASCLWVIHATLVSDPPMSKTKQCCSQWWETIGHTTSELKKHDLGSFKRNGNKCSNHLIYFTKMWVWEKGVDAWGLWFVWWRNLNTRDQMMIHGIGGIVIESCPWRDIVTDRGLLILSKVANLNAHLTEPTMRINVVQKYISSVWNVRKLW